MIVKTYRVENKVKFQRDILENKIYLIVINEKQNPNYTFNIQVLAPEEEHNKLKKLGYSEV